MKENVIVSLADENYFDLLNELVESIKNFEFANLWINLRIVKRVFSLSFIISSYLTSKYR